MSTRPPDNRRRSENAAVFRSRNKDENRRNTFGGGGVLNTPSKQQVSLGSSAASAYYFSDLPKTPSSILKKRKSTADDDQHDKENPTTPSVFRKSNNNDNTGASTTSTPMSSSSDGSSDIMNKSVLSDTTELTASNFVFAASSRHKMKEASQSVKKRAKHDLLLGNSEEEEKAEKETLLSAVEAQKEAAKKALSALPNVSRMSSSPRSLRTLSDSLKKHRLKSEQERTHRLSFGYSTARPEFSPVPGSGVKTQLSPESAPGSGIKTQLSPSDTPKSTRSANSSAASDTTSVNLSQGSLEDLFGDMPQPSQQLLSQESTGSKASDVSLLASPPVPSVADSPKISSPAESSKHSLESPAHSIKSTSSASSSGASDTESINLSQMEDLLGDMPQPSQQLLSQGSKSPDASLLASPSSPSVAEFRKINAPVESPKNSMESSESQDTAIATPKSAAKSVVSSTTASIASALSGALSSSSSPTGSIDISKSLFNGMAQPSQRLLSQESSMMSDVSLLASPENLRMDQEALKSPLAKSSSSFESPQSRMSAKAPTRLPKTPESTKAKAGSTFRTTPNKYQSKLTPTKVQPSPLLVLNPESKQEPSPHSLGSSASSPDPHSTKAEDRAPFYLQPNNHQTRLTPTKVQPSPRRIANPKAVDSPARRTRSAMKRMSVESPESTGVIEEIVVNQKGASSGRVSDITFALKSPEASKTTADRPSWMMKSPSPRPPQAPKGILSTKKKRKLPPSNDVQRRKSVMFGSPEAAEYVIGTPSVNLTPMPAKRARALYPLPSPSNKSTPDSESSSDDGANSASVEHGEETMDIQAELGAILDTSTDPKREMDEARSDEEGESPAKSESSDSAVENRGPVGEDPSVASSMGESKSTGSDSDGTISEASTPMSEKSRLEKGEETMEIEAGLQELLATTDTPGNFSSGLKSSPASTSSDDSLDKDASPSSNSDFLKDEKTVELEGGLNELLHAAAAGRPVEIPPQASPSVSSSVDQRNESTMDLAEPLTKSIDESKTIELEIGLAELLNSSKVKEAPSKVSQEEVPMPTGATKADDTSFETSTSLGENKTVELESGLADLLNSSKAKEATVESFGDTMEMCSLGDNTTSNLSSQLVGRSLEETKTIELESNLARLIDSSSGQGDADDQESSSVKSEKVTALAIVEGHKMEDSMETNTMELESNLASILGTSESQLSSENGESSPQSIATARAGTSQPDRVADTPGTLGSTELNAADVPDEENTIELETDMSALLAMASQEDVTSESLPNVRLSDTFAKVQSSLAPRTKRMSFGTNMMHSETPTAEKNETPSKEEPLDTIESTEGDESMSSADGSTGACVDHMESSPSPCLQKDDSMKGSSTPLSSSRKCNKTADSSLTPSSANKDVLVLDFGSPAVSNRKRRSSRKRFSLASRSRLSLASDGSVSGLVSSAETKAGQLETDLTPSQTPIERSMDQESLYESVILDLSNKEIDGIVKGAISGCQPPFANEADAIVNALFVIEELKSSLINKPINDFFEAVCGEIEGNSSNIPESEAMFDSLADETNNIFALQEFIRTKEGEASLAELSRAVKSEVEFELMGWESLVAEQLVGPIDQTSENFSMEESEIRDSVKLAASSIDTISIMNERIIQKTRKRCMHKWKSDSEALEAEIEKMQAEINDLNNVIEDTSAESETVQFLSGSCSLQIASKESMDEDKAKAAKSQGRYVSLKGLTSATPTVVVESEVSLAMASRSPLSCVSLSFLLSKDGSVTCNSQLDTASTRGRRIMHSKSAAKFVKKNFSSITARLNKLTLGSSRGIATVVNQLEWTKGRIESTASELSNLQKRFNMSIESDLEGNEADFLLRVDFNNSTSKTEELAVFFELNQTYPFGVLNVSIESETEGVDTEAIQRLLVKNAKPGFGYLSRSCDVISSFLGN